MARAFRVQACLLGGIAAAALVGLPGIALAQSGAGAVVTSPGVGSDSTIDYGAAKPLPLPTVRSAPPSLRDGLRADPPSDEGAAGGAPGKAGSGKRSPLLLTPPKKLSSPGSGVEPQEFGSSGHPFTTSRTNANGALTVQSYPFSAAGKLFFNVGASTYVCSAAMIKRGVVVTAAHCVANFGARQFYTNWRFVPAYNNGTAPFGSWTAKSATVLTSYYAGTDVCAVRGVVCANDVAVLTLNPQAGAYAGARTGWLGYGYNGYSYSAGQAQITQLGYPVALDAGALQERTDSLGFVSGVNASNTVIGSLQTGGSSGGAWVVNLGVAPSLSGTSFGAAAAHNIMVGVTSWGYTSTAVKQQGASPFTSTNINALVTAACTATPAACT